ncbi:MAG: hypothetical protein V4635_05110 [Bacteroidota bacterium]
MKAYRICLFLVSGLFLSGCLVVHSGSVSGGPVFNRQDKYIDIARGKSRDVAVFGFSNLMNDDLVQKAKENLYLQRPLKNDEYYSNFATSIASKYILLFIHITKVTVSAEVLAAKDTVKGRFGSTFTGKIHPEKDKQSNATSEKIRSEARANGSMVMKGDSVYYSANAKDYQLYVVSDMNAETIMLLATNANTKNTLTSLKHPFFIKNIEMGGYKGGDKVVAEIIDANNLTEYEEGTVLGVSDDYFLVKTTHTFHVLPATRLKKKK